MAYGTAGPVRAGRRRAARGSRRRRRSPPRTRSCSATTCASPGASTRPRPCCERRRARTRGSRSRWLSLAEVHIKAGKLAEATADYEHVLDDRRPTTSRPCAASATSRSSRRTPAAGRAALRAGSSRSTPPTQERSRKLGVVRMRTGRPEEAIALFRRAIEQEPKNGEALLYLAGALASTGRAAEALPFFERALDAGQRNHDGAERPRAHAARPSATARGPRPRSASRCASTRSSPRWRRRWPSWR